ncbi:hypothetical protein Q9966_012210 [Columba livia]|nr:hypothetical protein Q9966_012210 [Columba livia]
MKCQGTKGPQEYYDCDWGHIPTLLPVPVHQHVNVLQAGTSSE